MDVYTVAEATDGWQVLKVGRFFCMADNQHTAQSLAASLNAALTPRTVAQLKADDIENPSVTPRDSDPPSRKFSATSWKRLSE